MVSLPPARLQQLRELLAGAGIELHNDPAIDARLSELRGMYEPFLDALGRRFLLTLPPVVPDDLNSADNWQRSRWMPHTPGIGHLAENEHFT